MDSARRPECDSAGDEINRCSRFAARNDRACRNHSSSESLVGCVAAALLVVREPGVEEIGSRTSATKKVSCVQSYLCYGPTAKGLRSLPRSPHAGVSTAEAMQIVNLLFAMPRTYQSLVELIEGVRQATCGTRRQEASAHWWNNQAADQRVR